MIAMFRMCCIGAYSVPRIACSVNGHTPRTEPGNMPCPLQRSRTSCRKSGCALLRLWNGGDGVGGDDLIAFVEQLLGGLCLARAGGRKNKARDHGDLNEMLFKEPRQVIGGTRFGNELRRFGQLGDLVVGELRRADEGDQGIRFLLLFCGADVAASGQPGANSVLRLVFSVQLALFELVTAKFFQRSTESIQLGLKFRFGGGGYGQQDHLAFAPDDLRGLLSHHLAHPLVEADVMSGRLELAIIDPRGRGSDGQDGEGGEQNVLVTGGHGGWRDNWGASVKQVK